MVFKIEGIQVPTLDLGRSFDDLHCLLLKYQGAFNNQKLSQAGFYVSLKTNSLALLALHNKDLKSEYLFRNIFSFNFQRPEMKKWQFLFWICSVPTYTAEIKFTSILDLCLK